MRRSKSWWWPWLAALAAILAVAAGCGSNSSDSTSTNSSATASDASGSSTSDGSTAASSKIPAATQEYFDANIKTPTDVGMVGPLSKKPPSGLTVDFLACNLPTCEQQARYFTQAVKHFGWKTKTVVFQSSAEGIQNAFNTAITDKPTGGVVTSGFPKQTYAKQLATLKQMKIPVVDYFSGNEAGDGIISAIGNQAILKFSDNMTAWVTVDSGGTGHAIEFNVPSFAVQAIMQKRIEENLTGRQCTDCKYTFNSLALTDIGPNLPAKVVSAVQKAPDTKYLIFGFSELTTGVPAALKNAGLADKVKIVTSGPEQPTFQSIINGEIAAAAAQPLEQQQWCMADALARYHTGDEVPAVACDLPSQILVKDNVPEAWPVWPGVPNWKQTFEKNWHVS